MIELTEDEKNEFISEFIMSGDGIDEEIYKYHMLSAVKDKRRGTNYGQYALILEELRDKLSKT